MKKLVLSLCLGMSSLFAYNTYEAPYEGTKCISQGWSGNYSHGKITNKKSPHNGKNLAYAVDIGGSFEVLSPADGTVVKNGWHDGMGNYVIIQHSDGLYSQYAHLQAKSGLKETAKISEGNLIGMSGNTGKWSEGAHLHMQFSTVKDLITDLARSRTVSINGWDGDKVWSAHDYTCQNGKGLWVGSKNKKTTTQSTPTPLKITSIKPVCPTVLNMGDVKSCTATAYYSDGTNKDITSGVSWSVMTNSTVLKVSGGKLTVLGAEKDTVARVKITYPNATANGADITIKGLDGQNPKTYQNGLCLKDTKKFTTNIKNGKLHLYYSKTCETNFGILEPTKSTSKTKVKIVREGGGTQSYEKVGTINTPMLFSPSKKVCVYGSVDGATESKGSCK